MTSVVLSQDGNNSISNSKYQFKNKSSTNVINNSKINNTNQHDVKLWYDSNNNNNNIHKVIFKEFSKLIKVRC